MGMFYILCEAICALLCGQLVVIEEFEARGCNQFELGNTVGI
jgi:hypothetical protein